MKTITLMAVVGAFILVQASSAQIAATKEKKLQISKIQASIPAPGVESRRVYGDTVAITFGTIKKGAKTVHHSHPDEQITIITSGQLRFVVEGRSYDLVAGDVFIVPSSIEHQAESLADGTTWTEVHGPGFHKNANFAREIFTEFNKKP